MPEIVYVVEQKLRRHAKYAVIGKWKVAKSFFTIQLGMAIASGAEFLGFKTTRANVLYVNFEISDEMFQQRIQDVHHATGHDLAQFKYLTIPDLSLDLHTSELEAILRQCMEEGFSVEVVVIDPRWKAIRRDSNQDEVLNAFCVNLDRLMGKYKITLSIVHHEGVATSSNKAGKGSTVFDAWLDGWFKIKPQFGLPNMREIDIWSRDSERESIIAEFDYPIHKVAPNIVVEKKAKTDRAKQCILGFIQDGDKPEKEVRYNVLGEKHSDYAYWRARKELLEQGRIKVYQALGPGNRKMIGLLESNTINRRVKKTK